VSDVLQHGLDWLQGRRREHLSRTVTYRRGADSVEVAATVGETAFRLTEDYGAQVRVVRRDYLIAADDLVLGGQQVLPQAGDRTEETDGDQVFIYEVMGPGGGEPDWRYSDPYRRTLRIHTKHVATEAVP